MSDIISFLAKYKVLKGDDISHTSMGYPSGSYYIPYDQTSEFIKLYHEHLEKGGNMHITEKHKSISPVLIDLDFRYKRLSEAVDRVYTQEHLKDFITEYMKCLNEYVEMKDAPTIYVLEKEKPKYDTDKDVVKDGIHIMIPNIVTSPTVQFQVRDNVLKSDVITNVFKDCNFINSADDIIDHSVIQKNNWLMYGSSKPNGVPYKVTHTFKFHENDKQLFDIEDFKEDSLFLIKELSIRNKTNKTNIKSDKVDEITELESNLMEEERKKNAMRMATQENVNASVNTSEDIEVVKHLVSILSIKRCESYEDWIRIGWCLRNIDNELLEDWVEFSKQSDKYSDGECERLWDKMKESGLGIKTLHMWAKKDDPEGYHNVMQSSGRQLMANSLNTGTDWDIGMVIKHYYQHTYRCTSIKQDIWYYFQNHKWNKCENAFMLRNNISTTIYEMFDKYVKNWVKQKNESGEDVKNWEHERKSKDNIVKSFKNTNFKSRIMKTCADLIHERTIADEFHLKLDVLPSSNNEHNHHLLCFTNGVYDLDNGEFREGRPDDYISLSTNIEYVEYDERDKVYDEINKFMYEVQPDKEKREFILRTLANSLHGANREEKAFFWTGEGGNGKSKLYSLLENCMGEYAATISVSYLTQKRAASNSASPEMMKAIGRRFVVFQEPEQDEKVNTGILKEISGRDVIPVRGLYKDADSFKPQFQVILICNQLPALPADDGGTWRRVRKITFDSKFVDDPNPDNPNEFKIDQDLDKKWPEWKVPFMSLLIHYYNKYKGQANKEPMDIINATNEYQNLNDHYIDFIENHIEKQSDIDGEYSAEFMAIFDEFKEYCTSWSKSRNIIKKNDLQKAVEKRYGKPKKIRNKLVWPGLRLITNTANKMIQEDGE